jgi:hypothetical protein
MLNSRLAASPRIYRGFVFFIAGKSYKDTVAAIASFGDYACAILSNKIAELACLLAAKNC